MPVSGNRIQKKAAIGYNILIEFDIVQSIYTSVMAALEPSS